VVAWARKSLWAGAKKEVPHGGTGDTMAGDTMAGDTMEWAGFHIGRRYYSFDELCDG
jgi:hypothetical protein